MAEVLEEEVAARNVVFSSPDWQVSLSSILTLQTNSFCRLPHSLWMLLAGELHWQCEFKQLLLIMYVTSNLSLCCRQKWIAVASLDHTEIFNELKSSRKLAKQNKYEIMAVLWNPHVAKKQLMVSTVTRIKGFYMEFWF